VVKPADPWDEPLPPYWKCLVAALPEVLVGIQFLMATLYRNPSFGVGRDQLTAMMQTEFLVIHAGGMLGWFLLMQPQSTGGRIARAIFCVALFGVYVLIAAAGEGLGQLAAFVGLTITTYLGLLLNLRSQTAKMQLAARWFVGFAIFIVAIETWPLSHDVKDWAGDLNVVRAGAFYFLCLAAVELAGLYLYWVPLFGPLVLKWLGKHTSRR